MHIHEGGHRKKQRVKIFWHAMDDEFNPYRHHAGETLKLSLGYQHEIDDWLPRDGTIESIYEEISELEELRNAYSEAYD
jgi:hypothetical protein